ncbi:MAG: segregation/condensation protein A [Nitriliruptoraceae bacterium]|nr:segregation/condensation protein A [Nitriliruptoraceae bacterium]
MTYQVKLEAYEGPFDLLLDLIARRQVDITDIDLAEMTSDFLAHLGAGIEELDLETATRFLVVAATLIELKAARLLPADEREELEDLLGETRDLLYARLLEYRAFRDVARILDHRLHQHEGYVVREVPLEPWIQRLVPQTPLPIDVNGLAALAAAATAPTPRDAVDLTHIRRSYLTIREAALQVLDGLPSTGETEAFRALTAGRLRGDRVVLFLAVLELFKLGHVTLEQPDHRGALTVGRRHAGHDLDRLVADVEEPDPLDGAGDVGGAATADDVDGVDATHGAPDGAMATTTAVGDGR